jgi:hypothetical protein
MLRSVKALCGDVVLAPDGDAGIVVDIYFDDNNWGVRFLVVDTGHIMPQRRVLIAPVSVIRDQPTDPLIRVLLSRREIEQSPEMDSALPVSRQFDHPRRRAASDPHLRSSDVVIGYTVQALDGPAGRLSDLVLDGHTWTIRRLVVDTGKHLPGPRVLLLPHAVNWIEWPFRRIHVGLTRETVRRSPRA